MSRSPKQIQAIRKPVQTTILVRSIKGLELMAFCRRNKISVSAMYDSLLESVAEQLLASEGKDIHLNALYQWPRGWGLR